ncbi:EscU/YscU/HrcU family type III secretion system export apparatus switch protein [Vibrio mediterranei]|uniref:Flagellar biosynthetic protein FlhB n=1 Tax=Vibrio mediterranei TaxID=689 RepID=A0A3G4VN81_9VIBR|nr:EscU/YscU/HrcU family type III secretion system export apparatus switch protein [Vibrio mediterranei]AYV25082.1 EscU/YscU/HrcU family type III secretion system export apparatus switch protein [Vibrio mediterranei]MCG9790501.1 EscU/YscU/HrcU family type III secretion system export apparatus switch protein [Vibrio mediterranei]
MESTEPKKYPPTEKKLRDLKKKGQFPKTELAEPTLELIVFTFLFVSVIFLLFENTDYWMEEIVYSDVNVGFQFMLSLLSTVIGGLIIVKVTVSITEWVIINKNTINTESLGLKVEKLHPATGFKNIFGIEALSRSLRKVLELLFLLFLIKYVFDIAGDELNYFKEINNRSFFIYSTISCLLLVSLLFLVYGVSVGCVDFLVERYHFERKNRMTFTEMKNEMKETEGSPEIKWERKRKMREVMETPITKGRTPTFALANPTHILVPVCFDPYIDKIPVVLKISTDLLAQEEKKRLKMMNVPIIEHKPLARAFYHKMKRGEDFIPKEFYRDVAMILSALKKYKKNEETK